MKKRNKKRLRSLIILSLLITTISVFAKGNEPEIIGYTYDSGNTVWEMAERCCPKEMDVRDVVREIEEINDIKNGIVQSGVFYKVPVYKN